MKKFFLLFLLVLLVPVLSFGQDWETDSWFAFGDQINNAFFFVVDKIVALMDFFIGHARKIGAVVLLIAIFTAGLNYALTGQGLKENAIKILKATLFFLIAIAFYPSIIGWISRYTFALANESVAPAIRRHYENRVLVMSMVVSDNSGAFHELERNIRSPDTASLNLFSRLSVSRTVRTGQSGGSGQLTYTSFAPAVVVQVMFLLSSQCMGFAEQKRHGEIFPDFSRVLKGLICACLIIFTGVFALLEYLVCFLEFMLVASVGIILFPMSIWEGSKFLSEKFIGAVVGFFMKLLFCNIAVFLLFYGFVSMLSIFEPSGGFQGQVDQIIFITFICLLFFYICKSAPGMAQALLTGTPTLSATGAISAAAGAVAAASFIQSHTVGKAANLAQGGAASLVKGATAGGTAFMDQIKEKGAKGIGDALLAGTGAMAGSLLKDGASAAGKGAYGLASGLLGMNGKGAGGQGLSGMMQQFGGAARQGLERGHAASETMSPSSDLPSVASNKSPPPQNKPEGKPDSAAAAPAAAPAAAAPAAAPSSGG